MGGYWENMYSNQPGGNLWHRQYSSSEACRGAQAATGSYVRPDQCAYVDTTPPVQNITPPVQDITIIQDPVDSVIDVLKGIPKEFMLLGIAIIVLLFIMRR